MRRPILTWHHQRWILGVVGFFFSLAHVTFVYWERAGFITFDAARHLGAIKLLWLHFSVHVVHSWSEQVLNSQTLASLWPFFGCRTDSRSPGSGGYLPSFFTKLENTSPMVMSKKQEIFRKAEIGRWQPKARSFILKSTNNACIEDKVSKRSPWLWHADTF